VVALALPPAPAPGQDPRHGAMWAGKPPLPARRIQGLVQTAQCGTPSPQRLLWWLMERVSVMDLSWGLRRRCPPQLLGLDQRHRRQSGKPAWKSWWCVALGQVPAVPLGACSITASQAVVCGLSWYARLCGCVRTWWGRGYVQEKIEKELKEARLCVKTNQLNHSYKPRLRGDLITVRDIMLCIPKLQVLEIVDSQLLGGT
jgi:hypothetical protein